MSNKIINFKRLFLVCVLSIIFSLSDSHFSLAYEKEIKSLSSTMAEDIAKAGKKTIAVVDFTDLQGNVTELGRFLAEEFSVALAGAGEGFEVVDRTHLKSILQEHKLASTGLIDPSTARRLGEIAGVHALITGTITPFGDSVRLSVKILDTATAKVIGASTGNIAKTKAIEELLRRGIASGPPFSSQGSTTPHVPATSYVPSASSPMFKKIGDIGITVKRIMVSNDQVMVLLGFINQSDKEYRLALARRYSPDLLDEKGNVFRYDSGIKRYNIPWDDWYSGGYQTLIPKSNNDVTLLFRSKRRIDVGSNFVFSLKFVIYNSQNKKESNYEVSFTDIRAQKP